MAQLRDLLPKNYGYVVLAVAGGSLLNIHHMRKVGNARKEYGIKAPETYSDESAVFNRIMRAHMNYIEHYPFFATSALLGGLEYPRFCAGAGLVWLISRLVYAEVYVQDPAKRGKGFGPAFLAQMALLGCTIIFGVRQAGFIGSCRALMSRK